MGKETMFIVHRNLDCLAFFTQPTIARLPVLSSHSWVVPEETGEPWGQR